MLWLITSVATLLHTWRSYKLLKAYRTELASSQAATPVLLPLLPAAQAQPLPTLGFDLQTQYSSTASPPVAAAAVATAPIAPVVSAIPVSAPPTGLVLLGSDNVRYLVLPSSSTSSVSSSSSSSSLGAPLNNNNGGGIQFVVLDPRLDEIRADIRHELMLWVLLALLAIWESYLEWFVSWIPFYDSLKLVVLMWVIVPSAQGAQVMYKEFVAPKMKQYVQDFDEKFIPLCQVAVSRLISASLAMSKDAALLIYNTLTDEDLELMAGAVREILESAVKEAQNRNLPTVMDIPEEKVKVPEEQAVPSLENENKNKKPPQTEEDSLLLELNRSYSSDAEENVEGEISSLLNESVESIETKRQIDSVARTMQKARLVALNMGMSHIVPESYRGETNLIRGRDAHVNNLKRRRYRSVEAAKSS